MRKETKELKEKKISKRELEDEMGVISSLCSYSMDEKDLKNIATENIWELQKN